jgi:cellular nucleic acid-binding protein
MSEVLQNQLVGQVKWFSNRSNYGFITVVSEGDNNGEDIFVHQTSIKTDGFRTLRKGEYVSFDLVENTQQGEGGEANNHKYNANNITGVFGGKLMCDVQERPPMNNFNTHQGESHQGESHQGGGGRGGRGGGGRGGRGGGGRGGGGDISRDDGGGSTYGGRRN